MFWILLLLWWLCEAVFWLFVWIIRACLWLLVLPFRLIAMVL